MATVDKEKHAAILAKVKKLIEKNLDQKGITSIGLLELITGKVAELKSEHKYLVMNWVGRAITVLIKEGNARIGYSDTVLLRFYATK